MYKLEISTYLVVLLNIRFDDISGNSDFLCAICKCNALIFPRNITMRDSESKNLLNSLTLILEINDKNCFDRQLTYLFQGSCRMRSWTELDLPH